MYEILLNYYQLLPFIIITYYILIAFQSCATYLIMNNSYTHKNYSVC